jgi:hypothetical protein
MFVLQQKNVYSRMIKGVILKFMYKIKLILTVFLAIILMMSCKKETITIHENLVVEGNTPPNYDGIATTQIKIYVNKIYVDLLGIQPNDSVLNAHASYLKNAGLSLEARDTVIDLVLAKNEYYERLFSSLSSQMLEGTSKYAISQEVLTYQLIVQQLYLTGDTLDAQTVELEVNKLILLNKSDSLYQAGAINLNEFYAAFCNNIIYDEINMGSLNFTVSCFENYFSRQPTGLETTNGVDMVDGQSKSLLGSDGNSKFDFITIITTIDEFYQGVVIDNYRIYLSRTPNSYESYIGTQKIKLTNSLGDLKKSILRTDEYANF